MTILTDLLATRSTIVAERDALIAGVEARSDKNLTPDEDTKFRGLIEQLDNIDPRIKQLDEQAQRDAIASDALRRALGEGKTSTGIFVKHNETTYRKGGQVSYFRDLAKANMPGGFDPAARNRLNAHAQEMDVETRANMTTADGTGGEFVPPQWLMNEYIPKARAGRVAADLCAQKALPSGTDSINLPAVNGGSSVAEQTQGATVSNTDMTTTSVSAAVTTMAGQQRFAMQLLDQSPINFDEVVFQDILNELAVQVDKYVLSKASIGILNVTGIISVAYTDASPTVPEMYPKGADLVQQIHTTRFLPPQAWLMHPRRWGWMLSAVDTSGRPLVVPSQLGNLNGFAGWTDVRSEGSVGTFQMLPVYLDPNIPINLGAGTNEDRMIAARFDDLYLYEGALRTRVLFETDADTLQVRLQVWEYLAFLANRYPKSIGVMSGTGLITPTF